MITQASICALRAMLVLAAMPGRHVQCRSMARSLHVSPGSLLRVLGDLAHAGLLRPQRGRNGGFALARDPASISLLQVFNAADQRRREPGCWAALQRSELPAVHQLLEPALHDLEGRLRSTSVLELLHTSKATRPRDRTTSDASGL